jgi:hypothetical protein
MTGFSDEVRAAVIGKAGYGFTRAATSGQSISNGRMWILVYWKEKQPAGALPSLDCKSTIPTW